MTEFEPAMKAIIDNAIDRATLITYDAIVEVIRQWARLHAGEGFEGRAAAMAIEFEIRKFQNHFNKEAKKGG